MGKIPQAIANFFRAIHNALHKILGSHAPKISNSGTLAFLPVEIIQQIATSLPLESEAALAFTCKYINAVIGRQSWLDLKHHYCHPGPKHTRGLCQRCEYQRAILRLMGRDVDPRKATVCFKHGIIHLRRPYWKRLLIPKEPCQEGTRLRFGTNRIYTIEKMQQLLKGHLLIEDTQQHFVLQMPNFRQEKLEQLEADFTCYSRIINGQLIKALQIRIVIPPRYSGSQQHLRNLLKTGYYWPADSPFEALEIRLPHSDDGQPLSSNGKLRLNSYHPAFMWCLSRGCCGGGCFRGVNCVRDHRTLEVEPLGSTGVKIKIDMFINLEDGYQARPLMEEASAAHLLAENPALDGRSRVRCPRGICSMCTQRKRLEKIVASNFHDHEEMLISTREKRSDD